MRKLANSIQQITAIFLCVLYIFTTFKISTVCGQKKTVTGNIQATELEWILFLLFRPFCQYEILASRL